MGSGNGALLMRKRIAFVIINLKNDDINILGIYDFLYRNRFKVRFKGQVKDYA